MQPSPEEDSSSTHSCSGGPQPQPCACCAALAQLRMPWMDVAMQHAPHYPYQVAPNWQAQGQAPQGPYPPGQYAPPYPPGPYAPGQYPLPGQAYPPAYQQEPQESSETRTLFFKLPEFGKKKKKDQGRNSSDRSNSHRPGARKGEESGDSGNENQTDSSDAAPDPGGSSTASSEAQAGTNDDWESSQEKASGSKKKPPHKFVFGLQGLAVSLLGIIIPAFVLITGLLSAPKRFTLVTLHHPAEAITEFLLVAAVPIVNFLVWSAISKKRANLSRWLVMALGACIGTSLVLSVISFACLFSNQENLADSIGTNFSLGFTWLGIVTFLSASVSAFLANKLRTSWELESTRLRVSIQAVTGMVLAMLAFAGSEYRPWCIRMAQYNAVSADKKVRREGLRWLREINPEREMRMECSDSRAAGLPGLFFPIKAGTQQELYFTLTGTPYSFRDMNAQDLSSMPDDYLSRHVVGDKVPQLDLTRSTLNGILHPNTLTSTLNWTFVVKNGSSQNHEMRAEIGLPAGAAITGLTVWHGGEPDDADFVASGNKVEGITTTAGDTTPAMVTDLGHGRVLVHCYPVPREEELKVRVTMVVPLKSERDGQASLVTPQLIASNFDLEGEHLLRLRSKSKLDTKVKGLELNSNAGGESIISGSLNVDQLESEPLLVTAMREETGKPYAVLDKLAIKLRREDELEKERLRIERERFKEEQRKAQEKADKAEMGQVVLMIDGSKGVPTQIQDLRKLLAEKRNKANKNDKEPKIIKIQPEYAVEDIKRIAAPAPKHLVVVIDGSATMKKFSKDLFTALSALPRSVPTSVIIASQEDAELAKVKDIQAVLPQIQSISFAGGQDNLKAVVRGAELAGETKGSALLWIHGPQPVINQEIYIMSPYESQPAFYELPVVAGTDTYEFFKNHAEIGPFTQVPRNGGSIASDLSSFFSRWNPNNNSYVATISESQKLPDNAVEPSKEEGKELIMLRAVQECNDLIATRHYHRAARIATRYGFVSAVSSAFMGQNAGRNRDADLNGGAGLNSETNKAASLNSDYPSNGPVDALSAQAPMLQGATNSTIGPAANDAVVIQGVNTAGTVRVNNLANLEALLNIIANLSEMAALLSGLGLLVHGIMNKAVMKLGEDVELGPGGRMILGGILMLLGLGIPGVINWFVASARDANLFS